MRNLFRYSGLVAVLCMLIVALLATMLWGLSIGSVSLPLREVVDAIVLQLQSDTPIETVGLKRL